MAISSESLIGLGELLLLGAAVVIAALTWYTVYLLTHPPRRTYVSALARGRPGDPAELPPGPSGKRSSSQWTVRWRGTDLPVWDIQGDAPQGPVVILSHGWGD